jgi:hypothetical protein
LSENVSLNALKKDFFWFHENGSLYNKLSYWYRFSTKLSGCLKLFELFLFDVNYFDVNMTICLLLEVTFEL